jgi:hypothetical protein
MKLYIRGVLLTRFLSDAGSSIIANNNVYLAIGEFVRAEYFIEMGRSASARIR